MTTKPVRRTKTAFVKEHIGLSAGEIVARARKVGLEISPAVVHTIRSTLKRQGAPAAPMTELEVSRTIRRAGHIPPPPSDKRAQLQRLIVQVGYDAALAILDSVGESLDAIERKVLK